MKIIGPGPAINFSEITAMEPVVAVGVVLFILSCATNGILIHHGNAQVPYFITLSFLFVIAAMKFELSRDMLHAARLAAGAGELALWRWPRSEKGISRAFLAEGGRGAMAGE